MEDRTNFLLKDGAMSAIAPPRHCEPKCWQVCWREAISSLHIPFGVRCSGGIASPDCHQACNDVTKTLLIALQRS